MLYDKTPGELLNVAAEDSEPFIPTPKELRAWIVDPSTHSLTVKILSAMRRGESSVEVTPSSQGVLDELKTRFESRGWRLCCEMRNEMDWIEWQTEERHQLRQTVALFLFECFNRLYGERPEAIKLKSFELWADFILDTVSDFSFAFNSGLTLTRTVWLSQVFSRAPASTCFSIPTPSISISTRSSSSGRMLVSTSWG